MYKSQGKKKNMLIDWPGPHLTNTWLSVIRHYSSPNTPLPLRNWKYKWYQQVLIGRFQSPPTLRMGHFRRTTTHPEGWKFGHRALCWWERPHLRCSIPDEVDYVMREVHEGVCENHLRARLLVHKLVWAGYHWPSMQKDAQSYVKVCDKCQCFSKTSWLNIAKGSRWAPNPHTYGMDRQPRIPTIKDANGI